jgi:hypothetical protein
MGLDENEGLLCNPKFSDYIPKAQAKGISNNRPYLVMSPISGIHGSIYGNRIV